MTIRTVTHFGIVALFAQMFVQGCGSNNPATSAGGAAGPPPTGGASGAAGATASAPAGGTIGTPAGGVTAAAGATASTPTGGTTGAAGATASAPAGGVTAAAGATGTSTGGTSGAGGTTGSSSYQPSCTGLSTAGGLAPTKGGACTASDPQLCYKTCGPKSIGFKSETCVNGSYSEQTGCDFLPGDYSCYKIPAAVDATCPTTTPQASQPCTVADCVPCNVGGNYLDSTGSSKAGYCVCPTPTSATATSKWTCASTSAWPCPAGQGC